MVSNAEIVRSRGRQVSGVIPLIWGVVTLEQGLRMTVGQAKPLVSAHTPPGAASWGLLPLAALAFARSLTEADEVAARRR